MSGWVPEKPTRTVSRAKKNSPSGTSEEIFGTEKREDASAAKLTRSCIERSFLMVMERRFRDWQPSACQ